MCNQRYPAMPPVVRVVVDFIPDDQLNDTWIVIRRQLAWGPMRDHYVDHARNPVQPRVEGEWLDMLSMVLGSALLYVNSKNLPDPSIGEPAYEYPEAGTSSEG